MIEPGEKMFFESLVTTTEDPRAKAAIFMKFSVDGIAKDNDGTENPVTSNVVKPVMVINYNVPAAKSTNIWYRFSDGALETIEGMALLPGQLASMLFHKEHRDKLTASAHDTLTWTVKFWTDLDPNYRYKLIEKYLGDADQYLLDQTYNTITSEVNAIGQALGSGDYGTIAEKIGQASPDLLMSLCGAGIAARKARQVAKASAGSRRVDDWLIDLGQQMDDAEKAKRADQWLVDLGQELEEAKKILPRAEKISKKELGDVPRTLRGLKSGVIENFVEIAKKFGINEKTLMDAIELAKKRGINIMARYRHQKSIWWNEVRGAFGKFEQVKTKNVNQIDIDFLGYDPDDLAAIVVKHKYDVGLKGYTRAELNRILQGSQKEVKERILKLGNRVGIPDEEWELVLERYAKRVKESDKDYIQFMEMSKKGKAEMGFRYTPNDLDVDPNMKTYDFHIDDKGRMWVRDPDYQNPGNPRHGIPEDPDAPAEGFRRVTGDTDLVDVRKGNGVHLETEEERLGTWQDLQNSELDSKHMDSASWANQEAKPEFLEAHKCGKEPLLQICFSGELRVTCIVNWMSWPGAGSATRIIYENGCVDKRATLDF
ncbi:MAG: hypothetical protein HY731_04980 [Candidatus Tectomicrobia bacterium]|nr:hypothetical protein [Candidatus Tectomicrobia bacterium]